MIETGTPATAKKGKATMTDELDNEIFQPPEYAPLLYFFPEQNNVPAPYRGRFGLESGFWGKLWGKMNGDQCTSRQNVAGPEGKRGLLAAPFSPGENPAEFLQFLPDRQEWTEIEDGVWLGVDQDAGPQHFLREHIATPKYVLKHDRGQWWIPVALVDVESCGLPTQDALKRGEWYTVPRPGYRDLADRALYLYKYEMGETGENEELSREWLRETAVLAIGCNYALTTAEMAALDLLNTDVYSAIADLLTDKPAREKKTESE